jgi:hypothetical protein
LGATKPAAVFALGFRVKSGLAIAVALGGPASAPGILDRRVVALSDPAVPETRQPYHDGVSRRNPQAKAAFLTVEADSRELDRRTTIVRRCANGAVDALLNDASFAHLRCCGAGLVVGSVIDPARVGNPHIRAHASEGQLFRTVLADALVARGLDCDVIVDKTLAHEAVKRLRRTEIEIAQTVAALGKACGGPWRAAEKAACTAAWLLL